MTNESAPIALVTTGGTIDKAYFDSLSTYQVGETVVAHLLKAARVECRWELIELLRKDSLELTDADRAMLRQTIASLDTDRVVVTHGTDTMTQSAQALLEVTGKTIVMTGSLAPARFAESDATFNLGMAFGAVQSLPHGVYIAMNGQVFRGDRVRKDRQLGRFVSTP